MKTNVLNKIIFTLTIFLSTLLSSSYAYSQENVDEMDVHTSALIDKIKSIKSKIDDVQMEKGKFDELEKNDIPKLIDINDRIVLLYQEMQSVQRELFYAGTQYMDHKSNVNMTAVIDNIGLVEITIYEYMYQTYTYKRNLHILKKRIF
jgi:hypothetical protein